MRVPTLVLLLAALALPALAAGEDPALRVRLSGAPPVYSLEPGEAYLYYFTVEYPCGASRRIDLEARFPAWSEAAVQDLDTVADRCLAGQQGRHVAEVALAVGTDAPEGTWGELTLVAKDGNLTSSATADVKVRQERPVVAVEGPTLVLGVNGGEARHVAVNATYTLREPGRLRWLPDAPSGWRLAVPAARDVAVGEDVRVGETFVLTPPDDATGRATIGLRAVLTDASGNRLAESEPFTLRFEATPPPPPPEEPVEDAAASEGPEAPKAVAPRAPLWLVGAFLAASVVVVYAMEVREERRGRDAEEGARARDREEDA